MTCLKLFLFYVHMRFLFYFYYMAIIIFCHILFLCNSNYSHAIPYRWNDQHSNNAPFEWWRRPREPPPGLLPVPWCHQKGRQTPPRTPSPPDSHWVPCGQVAASTSLKMWLPPCSLPLKAKGHQRSCHHSSSALRLTSFPGILNEPKQIEGQFKGILSSPALCLPSQTDHACIFWREQSRWAQQLVWMQESWEKVGAQIIEDN